MSSLNIIPSFEVDPASFRDPSGFVFRHNGEVYRAIAPVYFEHFERLKQSGLFEKLIEKRWLINHKEVSCGLPGEFASFKIIKPNPIPFISYPYEWCFTQLKDAALLTLKVQKEALKHGMILKDASACNIQFIGPNPVFIDTLSFETYREGIPWNAYGQFCRHFFAPLSLMSYKGHELSQFLATSVDGIPLELASSLLPFKAKLLNSGIAAHIAVHTRMEKKYSGSDWINIPAVTLPKPKLFSLIEHLEDCIVSLKFKDQKTKWNSYAIFDSYTKEAAEKKGKIISEWLKTIRPNMVWDIGCNMGRFSEVAAANSNYVVAMDADAYCIEYLYKELKRNVKNILPLAINFSNPSPASGWANRERKTVAMRGPTDVVLALALVHHLRIGSNVPFDKISDYFSVLGKTLIIEFVPKEDKQVKQMLFSREVIFYDYNEENFQVAFKKHYIIKERCKLPDSDRILYLMESKNL